MGTTSKPKISKEEKPKVVRCNFQLIINWISENKKEIPATHVEAIMRTPFGAMFKPIYDGKVKVHNVGRISKLVERVIGTYSEKDDAFKIGGKILKLTPDDVAITFGLPKVGRNIVMQPGRKLENVDSDFQTRQFKGKDKLNKAAICEALKRTISEKGPQAEEDFARLMILYMFVTLFLANSNGSIGCSFLPHIEKFNNINTIAWATVIHGNLMTSIRKCYRDPVKTPGCVIQMLVSL